MGKKKRKKARRRKRAMCPFLSAGRTRTDCRQVECAVWNRTRAQCSFFLGGLVASASLRALGLIISESRCAVPGRRLDWHREDVESRDA